MNTNITITEIYATIQGEAHNAGMPCVMVRLTGCPLRCRWCDTVYSFEGGEPASLDAIVDKIRSFELPLVELTGGEPLAQPGAFALVDRLIELGYEVMIETGGSEPVGKLHPKTHIIMDIKCPGSGMVERNLWSNLDHLKSTDEIKFVLAGRDDFDWAQTIIREHHLSERFKLLMSPAFGLLQPKDLAAWMVEHRVKARLNIQQHKYIWSPRAKGV